MWLNQLESRTRTIHFINRHHIDIPERSLYKASQLFSGYMSHIKNFLWPFGLSLRTQVGQRDHSSNNKWACRSGNGCPCHTWAFSGRSNKTAQQWTILREKNKQRKVTFGKYVIPVYTSAISLYSQRTAAVALQAVKMVFKKNPKTIDPSDLPVHS